MKVTRFVFVYSQAVLALKGHPETAHLRTRIEILPDIARALGAQVETVSVERLLGLQGDEGVKYARDRIAKADVAIVDGPCYRLAMYKRIENEIAALDVPCFDTYQNVKRVSDMSLYLPTISEERIPHPGSVLIPFTSEDIERSDSKDFYKRALGGRIEMLLERGGIHPTKTQPAFYRTFFNSAVGSNVWRYKAESVVDLINSSYEVVYDKKGYEDVGGLAVREFLELEKVYPLPMHDVFKEYRIFVIGGQPIWYSFYHGLSKIDTKSPAFEELKEKATLGAHGIKRLKNIARKVAAAIPSHFFVIDVAFTVEGKLVVIDLGPGYSAGMAFKIDQVPVLAALLHYAAAIARSPGRLAKRPKVAVEKLIKLDELTEIVDTLKLSRLPMKTFCGLLL